MLKNLGKSLGSTLISTHASMARGDSKVVKKKKSTHNFYTFLERKEEKGHLIEAAKRTAKQRIALSAHRKASIRPPSSNHGYTTKEQNIPPFLESANSDRELTQTNSNPGVVFVRS